jgi:hypothetical protein
MGMSKAQAEQGMGDDSVHVPLFDAWCSEFGQELGPTSYTKDLREIVDYNFA